MASTPLAPIRDCDPGGRCLSTPSPRLGHHQRLAAVAALVISGLAAASCGGDSSGSVSTTTAPEREVVAVVLDEYVFSPATVSPGVVTAVRAQNLGGLEHSWSVLEKPIETELELPSATVLAEVRLEVGQSATVDIGDLSPGRYQVVCVIPGHVSAGMVGELIVDG